VVVNNYSHEKLICPTKRLIFNWTFDLPAKSQYKT